VDAKTESTLTPAIPPEPPRPGTVLVVEDHDVVRTLCRRVLEMEGHRVFEASNVQGALEIAEGLAELDLVVADVRLRGGNGVDVARALKAERPALRVLLMSGYAAPRTSNEAFLEKPFTPAGLVSAVRYALQR
jgi:two-component system cell cycle sensor histidine kinase/response regulator CckA